MASLLPDGETAVYDATLEAFEVDPATCRTTNASTPSSPSPTARTTRARSRRRSSSAASTQSPNEGEVVRVFTIAYGSQANTGALESFAEASGGKAFEGDPQGIEAVYLSISSFF